MTTPLSPLELKPESPLARVSAKCSDCKGLGRTVIQEPTTMYACGFTTVAVTCPACLGFGRLVDLPADNKTVSGGAE